jgi:hypothetical protein
VTNADVPIMSAEVNLIPASVNCAARRYTHVWHAVTGEELLSGRGLHSSTYQLTLSRFYHRNRLTHPPCPTESAYVELEGGRL